MDQHIIDYMRSCTECQINKVARHHSYGLSLPLELPYTRWQSIAIDFITELPLSEECDPLWVVIDCFTKMVHFLPLRKDEKTPADLAICHESGTTGSASPPVPPSHWSPCGCTSSPPPLSLSYVPRRLILAPATALWQRCSTKP